MTAPAPQRLFRTVLYELSGDATGPFFAFLREVKHRYGSRVILVCRTKEERAGLETAGIADIVISAAAIPVRRRAASEDEIMTQARAAEAKYGVPLHHMLIEQRQYFTGALNFPGTVSKRSYAEWLALLLDQLAFYEELLEEHRVTFVLHGKLPVMQAAKRRGIPVWRLEACLHELRYMWTDRHDAAFPSIAAAYHAEPRPSQADAAAGPVDVKPPSLYFEIRSGIQHAVRLDRVALGALREIARHYYYRLRGYDKAVALGFDGWAWARYLLRQRRAYNRLRKLAWRGWADVRETEYVFYPLSAEPELTLSFWSPEYFDQLSTIQQLAKELPAGVRLVVKEHMIAIGNRPADFYEIIAAMPNVVLVDPCERGLDIGSTARAVAVIASTAGTEAALQGIPTLVFAPNTWLSVMPHVRTVRGWNLDIRAALEAALSADEAERWKYRRDGLRMKRALDRITLDPVDRLRRGDRSVGAYLLDSLLEQLRAGAAAPRRRLASQQ